MTNDEQYMHRCLQLALNGKGYVAPNPMVGAVIVHEGKIIGEGFHREYGKAHAEVNAINSVKDKSLLKNSTIYVSLEPCSHYGKTPPCSQLIIDSEIPKVVVATLDPFPKVSGRGVGMLRDAGVEVVLGVLEKEAKALNKAFFTAQTQDRPYVILKWAQTKDGFIDRKRDSVDCKALPTPISNSLTKVLVHKLRSEVSGIMVGTNTAINDNPSLTTRFWYGKNPTRIVLDRNRRIPHDYSLFDNNIPTILFTEKVNSVELHGKLSVVPLAFNENMITELLKELNNRKINSLMVEGGAAVLQSFIDAGAWDEAYVEVSDKLFIEGVKAPNISGETVENKIVGDSQTWHLRRF